MVYEQIDVAEFIKESKRIGITGQYSDYGLAKIYQVYDDNLKPVVLNSDLVSEILSHFRERTVNETIDEILNESELKGILQCEPELKSEFTNDAELDVFFKEYFAHDIIGLMDVINRYTDLWCYAIEQANTLLFVPKNMYYGPYIK